MKKVTVIKRNSIIELTAALLLIFFVHISITTFFQLQSLKNLLAFYTQNTDAVAWAILIGELLISVLLFLPITRMLGFGTASLFAIFAGYTVLKNPYLPHDFGGILTYRSEEQHILIYSIILLISISGVFLRLNKKKTSTVNPNQEPVIFT